MTASNDVHVCQFINSASQTSIPADIATGLAKHTDIKSSILTWFGYDPFDGQEVVDIRSVDASEGFIDIGSFREACQQVSEMNVDVLHTHHTHAGFYAKAVGLRLRIPVVRTEQNTHDGYTTVGKVSNGLTNPLTAKVSCISEAVYNSFEGWERLLLSDEDIEIIPNGVSFDRVVSAKSLEWSVYDVVDADPDSVLIGNAAMFTEQKAHDILVRALAEVEDKVRHNIELVIAGDGNLREDVSKLARSLSVWDNVHFMGLLDRAEVYRMMEEVDLFCMPSRWEGYCVAVAEAMAFGTPCILSDIDVFTEVYDDAALYHPVDHVMELSRRIKTLVEDETCRTELGRQGRELVKSEYRLEQVTKQYESLYQQIV